MWIPVNSWKSPCIHANSCGLMQTPTNSYKFMQMKKTNRKNYNTIRKNQNYVKHNRMALREFCCDVAMRRI